MLTRGLSRAQGQHLSPTTPRASERDPVTLPVTPPRGGGRCGSVKLAPQGLSLQSGKAQLLCLEITSKRRPCALQGPSSQPGCCSGFWTTHTPWAQGPWQHLPILLLGWLGLQALGGGSGPRRASTPPPSLSSALGTWSHGKFVQTGDRPAEAIRPPGRSPAHQKAQSGRCLGLGFGDATAQQGFGEQAGFSPSESTHIGFPSFVLHLNFEISSNDNKVFQCVRKRGELECSSFPCPQLQPELSWGLPCHPTAGLLLSPLSWPWWEAHQWALQQ